MLQIQIQILAKERNQDIQKSDFSNAADFNLNKSGQRVSSISLGIWGPFLKIRRWDVMPMMPMFMKSAPGLNQRQFVRQNLGGII